MNCWDILGIEPTGDHERIRQAYERQMKFASDNEAQALEQAFREATGGTPAASVAAQPGPVAREVRQEQTAESGVESNADRALDAHEAQVVREVVIQIKALMNDNQRQQDAGIWKAILCEPPADQLPLRREIAKSLEPQIRPMAENGSFPRPVAQFLGDWFDWFSVREASHEPDPRNYPDEEVSREQASADQADQPPQMVNFWPAVIGWIVGLVILATLFGGMGG